MLDVKFLMRFPNFNPFVFIFYDKKTLINLGMCMITLKLFCNS